MSLRPSNINAYKLQRCEKEGAAAATCNRELALLRAAFYYAKDEEHLILHVPKIKAFKEDNARTGFVTEADYQKLIPFLERLWFRIAVEIGHAYGWRLEECVNLRCSNVDLDSGQLFTGCRLDQEPPGQSGHPHRHAGEAAEAGTDWEAED
jgi:integrase